MNSAAMSNPPPSPHDPPPHDEFAVALEWPEEFGDGTGAETKAPEVAEAPLPANGHVESETAALRLAPRAEPGAPAPILSTFNALLESIDGVMSSLRARLDELTLTTAAAQRRLSDAIDQLASKVDTIASRVDRPDDTLDVAVALERLAADVEDLRQEVAGLRRRIPVRNAKSP